MASAQLTKMIRPSLSFVVHGTAVPKGSMRAFMPKGAKHPVLTSTSKNLKKWEADIRTELQLVMKRTDEATLLTLWESPIAVGLRFHIVRPKSRKKDRYPVTRPDVDKLARSAIDALSTVVFKDDSQVVALQARKVYSDAGGKVEITIEGWGETLWPMK